MENRKIIHVDMDCFYAAVEEKYNPKLKGVPMAVGGPPNSRSVVCTANYEARKFGVKAAVPSSRAVRLCPHLILVPPHFDLYKKESQKVQEIFRRFTSLVQPLSLDEAFLDVTDSTDFRGSATLIAQEIRRQILEEVGLAASAGISSNKFLAKVASDWNKPNGQYVIRPADIEKFMQTLPIEKIYGVGKVTAEKMHSLQLFHCGDLQKLSLTDLCRHFGSSRAQELFQLCRGVDDRPVHIEHERKSLSVEETFSQDIHDLEDMVKVLPSLFESWQERFSRYEAKRFQRANSGIDLAKNPISSSMAESTFGVRGLVVKMKFSNFKTSTHEESFRGRPQIENFEKLVRAAWQKRPESIRLLGLGVRLASTPEDSAHSDQLRFAI